MKERNQARIENGTFGFNRFAERNDNGLALQSGGKFDGGKEAAQQLRADYITEMMSVSMAKQYTWHISMAINVLAHNKAEVHLVCSDLEPATYKALQRVYASGKFAADARNTLERCADYS